MLTAARPAPQPVADAAGISCRREKAAPLVEIDGERILRRQRIGEAEAQRLVGWRLGESAEQPVPDNEYAGEVTVETARVGGMMDAVVARQLNTQSSSRKAGARSLCDRNG